MRKMVSGDFRPEQYAVAAAFRKAFAAYQDEPLVLYGIGVNTDAILSLASEFSIVGLLDRDVSNVGKIFYGKQVLSLDDVATLSQKIIIVAQPLSVPIIFTRISKFAAEHCISVYDVSGRELGQEEGSQSQYNSESLDMWGHTRQELLESIARHDVISFDVFDTLLGRYVLHPTDLFELVEQRFLKDQGRMISFKSLRIQAQRDSGYAPSLRDIYAYLHKSGVSLSDCKTLYSLEIQLEKQLIYPKQPVLEIFRYAKSQGKAVFLTSDMYFPKLEMEELLHDKGICDYDGLLISCEEKAEKSDGMLFLKLREKTHGFSILHIGDNPLHDESMARGSGCDAWRLWNGSDLFAVSSLRGMLAFPQENFGIRLALGLICAKLFSDPFILHKTKGRFVLSTPEQVGYCFVGPWALGFMQWISKQAELLGIEQLLYLSREGFLFFHLGQLIQKYGYMPNIDQFYIKASRHAVSVASLRTEQDIKKFLVRRESNYRHDAKTRKELLELFFSIHPSPDDQWASEAVGTPEEMFLYLRPYFPEILQNSAKKRTWYLNYLKNQNVLDQKKAAVFDFVAQGTIQTYLEELMEKKLIGLYMAVISHSREKFPVEERIYSAYGNLNNGTCRNSLAVTYVAMEAFLTDGDEMLLFIDDKGRPVFRHQCDRPDKLVLYAQESVCAFAKHYLELFGIQELNLNHLDHLLGCLFDRTACMFTPELLRLFCHDDAPIEEVMAAWGMPPAQY